MILLTTALLSILTAADEPETSRFYFAATAGPGAWVATSLYNSGSKNGATGTRDIQAFSLGVVSTVGFRPSQALAIGGQIQLDYFPLVNATENRSAGFRPLTGVPFGISSLMGPSLTLFPGALRFDISPGFLWVVTGPEARHTSAAFGGTGAGISIAGGYDLPINSTLAVALELRATTGFHLNSDSTHIIGFDAGFSLMAGVRRR